MNYREHADGGARGGIQTPTSQLWFNKQVSCVNGPFDHIEKPACRTALDYEGELGVVLGRRCEHVAARRASVVAGYLVVNDVSVRDWQFKRSRR